jgi:putative glycosyltransferase (TIGR04372 family)
MTDPSPSLQAMWVPDKAELDRLFSPETLVALLRLVLPHMQGGKRALVYVLPASGKFAHMALEPWALANLFGDDHDRILVVIPDWDRLPHSQGMHRVSSENVTFVETPDEMIPLLGHCDGASHEAGPFHVYLQSAPNLLRDLWRHVRTGKALKHLALPAAMEREADRFLEQIGLSPEDRFVTVHMREEGYLPGHGYHGFRNMTPENYKPAINKLLEQGIWVFRLGDEGSTPLEINHPRFVDLPTRADHADFMDVVLLARAWFAICCSSGPLGPALAFGTPVVLVNGIVEQQSFFNPRDIIQFKRYVDEETGQPIPYGDLLHRGLAGLSLAKEFEERRVRLEENTAEEILDAAGEMVDRLNGKFEPQTALDESFRSVGEAYLAKLESDDAGPHQPAPLDQAFGLALPWTNICQSYCRTNPWFLGVAF